jgi:hypothetical protein
MSRFLDATNIVVLIAFAVDYLVELWLARALPRVGGRRTRPTW